MRPPCQPRPGELKGNCIAHMLMVVWRRQWQLGTGQRPLSTQSPCGVGEPGLGQGAGAMSQLEAFGGLWSPQSTGEEKLRSFRSRELDGGQMPWKRGRKPLFSPNSTYPSGCRLLPSFLGPELAPKEKEHLGEWTHKSCFCVTLNKPLKLSESQVAHLKSLILLVSLPLGCSIY